MGIRLILRALQWIATGQDGLLAEAAARLPLGRRALTPIAGALVATAVLHLTRKYLAGRKNVDYVQAVQLQDGRMPFRPTAWRTLASACSIATGASIGREGSMIQFAAASIAGLGVRLAHRWVTQPQLVTFATAAAVAAVYQAPLAGIFFAVEIVLGLKALEKSALRSLPALAVAAASGSWVSAVCLGHGPLFAVTAPPQFVWRDSGWILVGTLLFGVVGPAYFYLIEGLRFLRKWPGAMLWSGAAVGLLSCIRPEVWGNGDSGVLLNLSGKVDVSAVLVLLLLRLVATSACVGSGVVGGVFTPTLFAGSALGLLYAANLHLTSTAYALLGIACLLASVTHAPVMSALVTVELTGTHAWLPVFLLCSWLAYQTSCRLSPDSLYAVATQDPGKVPKPATAPVPVGS